VIETWLMAIRDHANRPPALQRHVLTMLALRMDWTTGRGFASAAQLAGDSDAEERTVRRATRWARDHELLLQTRRGHYISKETRIASEWQLTRPVDNSSQPDTGDLLGKPTGQNGKANRTEDQANRSAAHHHQETVFNQETSTSAGPRTEACKSGDHQLCMFTWCSCTCGHPSRRAEYRSRRFPETERRA
jgi:hypothetical protein